MSESEIAQFVEQIVLDVATVAEAREHWTNRNRARIIVWRSRGKDIPELGTGFDQNV